MPCGVAAGCQAIVGFGPCGGGCQVNPGPIRSSSAGAGTLVGRVEGQVIDPERGTWGSDDPDRHAVCDCTRKQTRIVGAAAPDGKRASGVVNLSTLKLADVNGRTGAM